MEQLLLTDIEMEELFDVFLNVSEGLFVKRGLLNDQRTLRELSEVRLDALDVVFVGGYHIMKVLERHILHNLGVELHHFRGEALQGRSMRLKSRHTR